MPPLSQNMFRNKDVFGFFALVIGALPCHRGLLPVFAWCIRFPAIIHQDGGIFFLSAANCMCKIIK